LLLFGERGLTLADLALSLVEESLTFRGELRRGIDCRFTLDDGCDRDLPHVDLARPIGELLLRCDELLVPPLDLREPLLELGSAGIEVDRFAFDALAVDDLPAIALLPELALGPLELVLAPLQVGAHALELLSLRGIGAPVPHRREPAALSTKGAQPPAETPLTQRELLLQLIELPLSDGDRSRPRAQHALQVFELVAGARPVMTALKNPLCHRFSNVHALCGNGSPQYDLAVMGEYRARVALVVIAAALVTVAVASGGSVVATPISSDPYTNLDSQHRTQVEPDSFGFGDTVVATFQTGRFNGGGGASNIGWATTTNAGRTWTTGMLPGTTVNQGGPWSRISDPAVAYDPLHDVWMISTLAFGTGFSPFGSPTGILVSRSTDGGLTWEDPPVETFVGGFLDKNWITCDTWPLSPHYGNCYQEWDDFGNGGEIFMNTSTDGGLTWSAPTPTGGLETGLGGQPVVQPNGTVVVPYTSGNEIRVFHSTDGGANWTRPVSISLVHEHGVAGNLRTSALPSAEVDAGGGVYVVWQDCRFRTNCSSNDIVMSTATDPVTWSDPVRIPIDPVDSGVDHFIPGIAVDRSTSGSTARLALGYYYYPVANCDSSSCDLTVGFVSSTDGGATWTQPRKVAGPFKMSWIAQTDQGPMVGDYISTSFAGGPLAFPVFAIAKLPASGVFDERAASARFDVTIPQAAPPIPVRRDPIRFRGPSSSRLGHTLVTRR